VAFRFLPVLSAEAADSSWAGARGWVSEHIPALLATGSHAYLCGPPPMIDAAALQLQALGVASADIHCDRFVSAAEAPAQAESAPASADPDAGLWHYAKFFGFHAVGLFSAISLLAGGAWTSLGLLAVVAFYIVGDFVSGDDLSTPRYAHPKVLTVQLWLALPLLALIVFCAVWSVSPRDAFGFGAWLGGHAGFDLLAARAATGLGHHLSALILTSLMIGMIGTITAHELTHRTWDTTSLLIGRWLLAFSFDTAFAIEHVYGHHRYVSTAHDPATAPRGRNVYAHIVLSTLRGNASAWRIERERLHKRGLPTMSRHNSVLRGQAMSIALLALAAGVGGWTGALMFVACGLGGKALLEIVNYMEHYGLLRSPQSPVQPRHSWNTNRRVSSWTLFNLTRHSHHHAQGEIAYQNLRPMADAPQMLSGYLTVLVLTLIPPLWQRLMAPKLLAWDRDFADAEERRLAAAANARSGLKSLQPGA
jgi:hypothetical protein